MKNVCFLALCLFMTLNSIKAQKFFTRSGNVSFYSDAPLEKIEAKNTNTTSVLDTESGRIEFAILIKAFQFKKALMQEHFNENYMESSKYPKATFKGEIVNKSEVNFSQDGTYPAKVKGTMNIHGKAQEMEAEGTFTVKNGQITASSTFEVTVADYDIKVPSVVRDNIAEIVRVDVNANYEPLK